MSNFKKVGKNNFINMDKIYNCWVRHFSTEQSVKVSGYYVVLTPDGSAVEMSDVFEDEQDAIDFMYYLTGVEKTS